MRSTPTYLSPRLILDHVTDDMGHLAGISVLHASTIPRTSQLATLDPSHSKLQVALLADSSATCRISAVATDVCTVRDVKTT